MEEKSNAKGFSTNWLTKSVGYSVACFHEHPGCVLNSVATRHSYSKIWRALSPTRTTRSILPGTPLQRSRLHCEGSFQQAHRRVQPILRLGAPGEADATINLAQEEEAPEQDEYVEVEVDSETLSIYEPLPPSGDEADVLAEEPSSSAAPAPVGSGSLSSRTPLVLRPRQPGYPPVRIDREGTWAKIGGPLAQPEPVQPPAPGPAYPTFPHEAADPFSLPDSAWIDPATFACWDPSGDPALQA